LFEVVVILGVAAAVLVVTGAGPIIGLVTGPRYAAAAGALSHRRSGASGLVRAGHLGFRTDLAAPHADDRVHESGCAGDDGVLTPLASAHGARGAALATVCGEWAVSIGYLIGLTRSEDPIRLKRAVLLNVGPPRCPPSP
jgi:hypothetical protein